MLPIRQDWLQYTQEEVIDTDILICDSHHHLWYESEIQYTIDDLIQDIGGGHKIVKTVFVESCLMLDNTTSIEMQPVGETAYLNRVIMDCSRNEKIDIAAGIIGFVDLTLGNAAEAVMAAHIDASPDRFRGVRHTVAWDAHPMFKSRRNIPEGLLSDSRFRAGFSCLKKYNLSYDAWLFHPQLMELVELSKSYPEVKIILNHAGGLLNIGPYAENRTAALANWQNGIAQLSELPNTYIKLGGLGMDICGFKWSDQPIPRNSVDLSKAMAPVFQYCIEKFGVARCMFESNFPVDKPSYSYTVLWNAFKRITSKFSDSEKRSLYYNTAVDAYNL